MIKGKARVAIIGYGTVGKRVADAVTLQDDMEVAGVVKTKPSAEAYIANRKGYRLYIPRDDKITEAFNKARIETAGNTETLLRNADIAVVATPDGMAAPYIKLCKEYDLPVIIEGGEEHILAEVSFNAAANYNQALGKKVVRVVSCNTTALARILWELDNKYGVEEVNATIIRRAADPNDIKTGPINALVPEPEISSHHGPDALTILPHIKITTMAVKASTTLMHLHALHVKLWSKEANIPQIVEIFKKQPRIRLVGGDHVKIKSTADAMELARDMGRPRGDMWENVVWENSLTLSTCNNELRFFQGVHQESIVVPENIDAIRAMLELEENGAISMEKTNKALGIY